jgi:hypothetical protein
MCLPVTLIQSCKHIKASTVAGVNQLRKSDIVLDPVLKADSDAIVDAGIANMSLTMRFRVGYSVEFIYHHARMLNLSLQ